MPNHLSLMYYLLTKKTLQSRSQHLELWISLSLKKNTIASFNNWIVLDINQD